MSGGNRRLLNLFYAAADGHEPTRADLTEAGIPSHMHLDARMVLREVLSDRYSSEDQTRVRHRAADAARRFAGRLPVEDSSGIGGSKNADIGWPMLDGRRHPIAELYVAMAERGMPSPTALAEYGVPDEMHHTIRQHTDALRQIWASGDQEEARRQARALSHALIHALGDDYHDPTRAERELPDDPRALAALIPR